MEPFDMEVKKLVENAIMPTKAHETDLGWDLHSSERYIIPAFSRQLVNTGIAMGFPQDVGGIIKDRSGISSKMGLFVMAGVIDPDYTGEIKILMFNSTRSPVEILENQKIAQMFLMPVFKVSNLREVTELSDRSRGPSGFGSSDK